MKIELENWPRREIYEFFSGMSDPFYMRCATRRT